MPADSLSATTSNVPRDRVRHFTVDEANRALTYVGPIVADVKACYQRAIELRKSLESQATEAPELVEAYEDQMTRLNQLLKELENAGVLLKDYASGLVDFPARYQDRTIFLCWQHGEARIQAWHEVDAGYAGREPIETLEEA